MKTDKNLVFHLALAQVEGIGGILHRQLVHVFGSPEAVFHASAEQLRKVTGIGEQTAARIRKKNQWIDLAQKQLETLGKQGVDVFSYECSQYPNRLIPNYDSPAILYSKGKNMDLNMSKTVAIVGTRKSTAYGQEMTQRIVRELQSLQPTIISGLALGIDSMAHQTALECQLPTVAVLANGLDTIYPAVHKKMAEKMMEKGGLISESPLGMKPIASLFLARNRIIAGLSDVCILVESAQRGGGMVTVEFAINYHKEVFAVPGLLTNKVSEGPHGLIKKNKAQIYTSIEDLVELLQWDGSKIAKEAGQQHPLDFSMFSEEESTVIRHLAKYESVHIDKLCWEVGIPQNRMAGILLQLEFQGYVYVLPGKKFKLK